MKSHGNTTHGETESPEYAAWRNMQTRCYNENCDMFEHYGGRGITICDRWLGVGGFERFLADMGTRPSALHSLDRNNNDLGYSPDNCRWATRSEQAQNQSTTKLTPDLVQEIRGRYEHGESQTSIARRMGVSQPRISKICRGEAWL